MHNARMRTWTGLLLSCVAWLAGAGALAPAESEEPEALARAAALQRDSIARSREGHEAEAERLQREAVALREGAGDVASDDYGAALSWLGVLLARRGAFEEAERRQREALAIRERVLGPDAPGVSDVCTNLGALFRDRGQRREAQPWYERALAIRRRAYGPAHARVAAALSNLGVLYDEMAQPARALPLHEGALLILGSLVDASPKDLTRTEGNLAQTLKQLGRLADARRHQEHVLEVREQLNAPAMDVALARSNLAHTLFAQGETAPALELLSRAVDEVVARLGREHPLSLAYLFNRATMWRHLGRFDEAEAAYRDVLQARLRVLGPQHPVVGETLGALGRLVAERGRPEEARPLFERAIAVAEAAEGPTALGVATPLNNLGALFDELGLAERAIPLYERALAIRLARLGAEHAQVAVTQANLATAHARAGRRDQALPLYEAALATLEKAETPDVLVLTPVLGGRALVRQEQGDLEGAQADYARVLALQEETLGPEHPLLAGTLLNLGWLRGQQGRHDEGASLYRRALGIREARLGREHPGTVSVLGAMARLDAHRGRHAQALEGLREALTRTDAGLRRRLSGLQGPERLELMRVVRRLVDETVDLARRVDVDVYADVLRFRGVVSRLEQVERRGLRRGGAEALARLERLHRAQTAVGALVHAEYPRKAEQEARAGWQRAYEAALLEEANARLAAAREVAALEEQVRGREVDPAGLAAALAPGEVLIDLLRTSSAYVAWCTPAGGATRRVDLGPPGAIDAAVQELHAALRRADSPADEELQRQGRLLRGLLAGALDGAEARAASTLVLVPDGALAALPFAALPGSTPEGFLGDEKAIVLLAQPHDLVEADATPTGRGALLLGGVDYATPVSASTQAARAGPPPPRAEGQAPALRPESLAPLPGSAVEVAAIGRLLGEDVLALDGSQATEAAVRRAAPGRRWLHFATHGIVREDLPRALRSARPERDPGPGADAARAQGYDPLLLCGLALAGAAVRDGGGGDDGLLTALEVSGLALDGVELAVLSACVSGRGTVESGEGILGLVHGFRCAGARRVVASLWDVSDDATGLLMRRFYEELTRAEEAPPPAEALRRAARSLRERPDERGRSFPAPRDWAAFVAYGR